VQTSAGRTRSAVRIPPANDRVNPSRCSGLGSRDRGRWREASREGAVLTRLVTVEP
jgi:hypothetical protein